MPTFKLKLVKEVQGIIERLRTFSDNDGCGNSFPVLLNVAMSNKYRRLKTANVVIAPLQEQKTTEFPDEKESPSFLLDFCC